MVHLIFETWLSSRINDTIAAATAQIGLKSQTVLLLCTPIFKQGANCLYKLISKRCGHENFDLWPHLILISLYKQLAPHLVHKSNTVCDFNTVWAIAAAIIVQITLSGCGISYYKPHPQVGFTVVTLHSTLWLFNLNN